MRLVFKELSEFEKWIQNRAPPDRYVVYITDEREIVFVPSRSTRPLTYGYITIPPTREGQDKLKLLEDTLTATGYEIYHVKDVEWADDRPVGVKFTTE